jgi:hypothetical protein
MNHIESSSVSMLRPFRASPKINQKKSKTENSEEFVLTS